MIGVLLVVGVVCMLIVNGLNCNWFDVVVE